MPWVELFAVLVVCHLVGDFLLQTDWQATHKRAGLGSDAVARRALLTHAGTYLLAFSPAAVWIAQEHSVGRAAHAAAGVVVPHAIQDDGRLLSVYLRRVKGMTSELPLVAVLTDQSAHVVALMLLALAAA